jgi:hypothetical protein
LLELENNVSSELLGFLTNVDQGDEVAAASKNRKQPKPSDHLKYESKISETIQFTNKNHCSA